MDRGELTPIHITRLSCNSPPVLRGYMRMLLSREMGFLTPVDKRET